MSNNKIIKLPKGGLVVNTKIGPIQLGVPPETIKDTIARDFGVPSIFISPKYFFSHTRMASLIDIEFPVYYNFFFKKQAITVLCTKNQKDRITNLFKEAFFGPETLNLEIEYVNGKENHFFPNMRKEMDYFAQNPYQKGKRITVDDLVNFVILNENETIKYKGIKFSLDTDKKIISIKEGKKKSVELPWDFDYEIKETPLKITQDLFMPPPFGITTLGSSHGFDPKGRTSGFIFWLNGSGIMIDPPIDSSLWLIEDNVDPRMVNSVILTHCHADHDAGVMQKILQEGRITLYTTATVFSNFIRKTCLITGLSDVDVIELIEFIPVQIGKPININGAKFTFSYRLHSVPTIGFEVYFKGKTVVYTSDHLNDQEYFEKLHDDGILTDGRYEELKNFNWNKDIIIHEAGIPPLHTPIKTILDLPDEVKKHVYLVHTEKSKIPADSGLTISPTGLSNTMIIKVGQSVHGESVQILNLISGLDIFQDVKFNKAAELLSIIKYRKFLKGDCIVKEGEKSKRFFIIIAGRAKLIENKIEKAILTSGSYFGETTLILDENSRDTIIALTDLITITIDKEDFLMFTSNTPIYEKLKKLGRVRAVGSWEAIDNNAVLNRMTINQKNFLELILGFVKINEGDTIIEANQSLEFAILWNTGTAAIIDETGKEEKEISQGFFIGNSSYLLGEKNPTKTLVAKTKGSFFKIGGDSMLKFFQKNPGIFLELRDYTDF